MFTPPNSTGFKLAQMEVEELERWYKLEPPRPITPSILLSSILSMDVGHGYKIGCGCPRCAAIRHYFVVKNG